MSDGTTADCPELTWHSSNTTSVNATPNGTLQVQEVPGIATITARCKDLSAQITVEVGRTLNVTVWVREPEPKLPGGPGLSFWVPVESAVAEVLDGPDRGMTFLPAKGGRSEFLLLPVRIRLTADSYLPTEVQIDAPPDYSGRTFSQDVALTPNPPPPGGVDYVGTVKKGIPVTHDFQATRAGVLAVQLFWHGEYSSTMDIDVRCGGEPRRSTSVYALPFGGGLEADVPAGSCTLTLAPRSNYPEHPYRVRMTLR